MSTPYNDQWVLRRALRGRARRHLRARRLSAEPSGGGSEERSAAPSAATRALWDASWPIGRRVGRRRRWIDRDT
jgi:hypothetical protein